MLSALALGIGLGFGAGVTPGPFLTLVFTTALKRGLRAGEQMAMVPLITDAPIVLLVVLVLSAMPAAAVTVLAVAGGAFVIYVGIDTLRQTRTASLSSVTGAIPGRDLWRGVMVNALGPHPWLFWLSVDGPLLLRSWRHTPTEGLAFLAGFYGLLIGGKIGFAAAAAFSRRWFSDRWYRRLLMGAGVVLIAVGGLLIVEFVASR